MPEAKNLWEIMQIYRKCNAEVALCVKITHAATFRHQCEKQFANSGNISETWLNMFFFMI